jgi:hypothetical protein
LFYNYIFWSNYIYTSFSEASRKKESMHHFTNLCMVSKDVYNSNMTSFICTIQWYNSLYILLSTCVTCYLLPSLYVAAFVRRTTSSTDVHPLSKRSLYFLWIFITLYYILYTGCGTFFIGQIIDIISTWFNVFIQASCACKLYTSLLTIHKFENENEV